MNERIKELTGEALDKAMPQTWYSISPEDLDRIMEKFAELIVRECAAYAFSDDQDHKAMLNYFGVEE